MAPSPYLWADNGGPGLGTDLGMLATIDDSTLSGTPTLVDITPIGGETLTANTRYWIEVTSTGDGDSWAYSTSTGGPEVATEYVDVNNAVSTDIVGEPWIASIETTSLCFAAGTRILAENGEVPVESLLIGDRVVALRLGGLAPIRWIGRRDVDLRRHPAPRKDRPGPHRRGRVRARRSAPRPAFVARPCGVSRWRVRHRPLSSERRHHPPGNAAFDQLLSYRTR